MPSDSPREGRSEPHSVTLHDFNLLVSSGRGEERNANSELQYLICELGDKEVRTGYTLVSGLTVAKTALDPTRAIDDLRSALRENPWKFRYVLKVKPVRAVVTCSTDEIAEAVVGQLAMIGDGETFRVSVKKRRSKVPSKEIIDIVASKIPRRVELERPDKLVMIEIIGDLAGVSIVRPTCILGVEKEKRSIASRQPTAQKTR